MNWQPATIDGEAHRRVTARPADLRREAEDRVSKMPLWVAKTRGANAGDWLAGIALAVLFVAMVVA